MVRTKIIIAIVAITLIITITTIWWGYNTKKEEYPSKNNGAYGLEKIVQNIISKPIENQEEASQEAKIIFDKSIENNTIDESSIWNEASKVAPFQISYPKEPIKEYELAKIRIWEGNTTGMLSEFQEKNGLKKFQIYITNSYNGLGSQTEEKLINNKLVKTWIFGKRIIMQFKKQGSTTDNIFLHSIISENMDTAELYKILEKII